MHPSTCWLFAVFTLAVGPHAAAAPVAAATAPTESRMPCTPQHWPRVALLAEPPIKALV